MPYNGNKEYMYHLHIKPGDVGRYVLLPGDPFRTDRIAARLENAQMIAHSREHKTWTGYLDGERVSVTSTGMGCPSAAIAAEELIRAGAETLIRIGTAGPVCDVARDTSVEGVIATAAVRDEGTTQQYIPTEYPAVASWTVVSALLEAAHSQGRHCLHGIVQTKDAFYGEVEPEAIPNTERMRHRWEAWRAGNVLCSDMETAALLVVASIRGRQAGAVLSLHDTLDTVIDLACEAVRTLIHRERGCVR